MDSEIYPARLSVLRVVLALPPKVKTLTPASIRRRGIFLPTCFRAEQKSIPKDAFRHGHSTRKVLNESSCGRHYLGTICFSPQISRLYSSMVRSLENLPLAAVLRIHMRVH